MRDHLFDKCMPIIVGEDYPNRFFKYEKNREEYMKKPEIEKIYSESERIG